MLFLEHPSVEPLLTSEATKLLLMTFKREYFLRMTCQCAGRRRTSCARLQPQAAPQPQQASVLHPFSHFFSGVLSIMKGFCVEYKRHSFLKIGCPLILLSQYPFLQFRLLIKEDSGAYAEVCVNLEIY